MTNDCKISKINASLEPQRMALVNHPIYEDISTLCDLRIFMEYHVYAVWDFMSLLKSLQQQITGSTIPWLPSSDKTATRLINEIVLGEESDVTTDGEFSSHFEMYLQSMVDCGANISPVNDFLNLVRDKVAVRDAVAEIDAPLSVQTFVGNTFSTIESNQTVRIAAAFTFGREDLLPAIFEKIVDRLNLRSHGKLDNFRYYLNRHIELDADEHGPMAERMVESICGSSTVNWHVAELAAKDALQARLCLWDGMHQRIRAATVAPDSLRLQS
ncbi:MAG: DUF3050 domain-containing protein [Planctomycetaceae bacterium]|nr:DUF3050 domain-containing protein [Planctomycetaceae bacterium]MCP4477897.1 DUF3050 domain-containing protein [Planctomycetaceae bacterium]